MARHPADPLAELSRDAADESKPIKRVLWKILQLGSDAHSAELRAWASRELHGYKDAEDALPDYRHVRSPLLVDLLTPTGQFRGRQVSSLDLPADIRDEIGDEVSLTYGIGKIESLIARADVRGDPVQLGPPRAADLAVIIGHQIGNVEVMRVYWSVSVSDLRNVVDEVRTALIELVAEIRAGLPAGEHTPSRELAEQALQVAVYGDKNRVTVVQASAGDAGTATASLTPSSEEPGFWTTSRRIGAVITGLAIIVTAVAAILALHP
jgi:hypothetical protein